MDGKIPRVKLFFTVDLLVRTLHVVRELLQDQIVKEKIVVLVRLPILGDIGDADLRGSLVDEVPSSGRFHELLKQLFEDRVESDIVMHARVRRRHLNDGAARRDDGRQAFAVPLQQGIQQLRQDTGLVGQHEERRASAWPKCFQGGAHRSALPTRPGRVRLSRPTHVVPSDAADILAI